MNCLSNLVFVYGESQVDLQLAAPSSWSMLDR